MTLKLHVSEPLKKLREMLSESATFRTLVDAADEAEALTKIHFGYIEDEEFSGAPATKQPKSTPRAAVALEDFDSRRTTTSTWSTEVQMSVLIEATTLEADKGKSLGDRYLAFLERIQGVADDLRELAADLTRLNLQEIQTAIAPQRTDPNKPRSSETWWTILMIRAGG